MKQLFGFLMMGLVVGVVGCATNVEKGDELVQQGKYEEAIKLYEQVKSDDEEYGKAQEGIANCNFQLGEIEFNGKNWEKAIALYRKAKTSEAEERIAACNFQIGEIEFNAKNWEKAIVFYEKANTPVAKERISSCNFQLGEIEFNGKNWADAIQLYELVKSEDAKYSKAQEGIGNCLKAAGFSSREEMKQFNNHGFQTQADFDTTGYDNLTQYSIFSKKHGFPTWDDFITRAGQISIDDMSVCKTSEYSKCKNSTAIWFAIIGGHDSDGVSLRIVKDCMAKWSFKVDAENLSPSYSQDNLGKCSQLYVKIGNENWSTPDVFVNETVWIESESERVERNNRKKGGQQTESKETALKKVTTSTSGDVAEFMVTIDNDDHTLTDLYSFFELVSWAKDKYGGRVKKGRDGKGAYFSIESSTRGALGKVYDITQTSPEISLISVRVQLLTETPEVTEEDSYGHVKVVTPFRADTKLLGTEQFDAAEVRKYVGKDKFLEKNMQKLFSVTAGTDYRKYLEDKETITLLNLW